MWSTSSPCCEAGHRRFGENRVQEAKGKWPALRERFPGIELHLIGSLQSNKAREAVALFDAIHTIDRPKIAQAVAAEMAKQGKRLQLFIEVNTGEEPQKAGVLPKEAAGLLRLCREELGLEIAGLMCIPPHDEEPGDPFRLPRQARPGAGPQRAQHGHERRLRDGHCLRRHPRARRLADLRQPCGTTPALSLSKRGLACGPSFDKLRTEVERTVESMRAASPSSNLRHAQLFSAESDPAPRLPQVRC